MEVEVRLFRRGDQAEAKALVLRGMQDRWGAIDPRLNGDLNDIAATYADGIFVVAAIDGCIIGTGGLRQVGDDVGEVVRMSVAADVRRRGVGSVILERLILEARSRGLRRLRLETTADWEDARRFYEAHGFSFVGTTLSPHGDEAHYERRIVDC